MATPSSTLGPAPSARGAQGGALTVAAGGTPSSPRSGQAAAEATGATYRQIDYWCRKGLLGRTLQGVGSGGRRVFTDVDLEIVHSYRHLAALGCRDQWLAAAGAAVSNTRVRAGEWLLVTIAGHALRCTAADLPQVIHHEGAAATAWLVPLQAFTDGRPS